MKLSCPTSNTKWL